MENLWKDGFKKGDILTRTGGPDRWRVVKNQDWDTIEVICVVGSNWCKPGDDESNMAYRYDLIISKEDLEKIGL